MVSMKSITFFFEQKKNAYILAQQSVYCLCVIHQNRTDEVDQWVRTLAGQACQSVQNRHGENQAQKRLLFRFHTCGTDGADLRVPSHTPTIN